MDDEREATSDENGQDYDKVIATWILEVGSAEVVDCDDCILVDGLDAGGYEDAEYAVVRTW